MNLFGLSPGELLLIMMVALVVLGPEKLPETAASVGKWVREFRRATEEITAQFAAENPLAELQRAFSLTDEPVTVATVEEPMVVEEPETLTEASADATPMISSPSNSLLQVPARRRSEYFERPVYTPGIATIWTHGAVEDRRRGRRGRDETADPSVASEWMHGAPLPIPSSSNGHASAPNGALAISTERATDASIDQPLTTSTVEATFEPQGEEAIGFPASEIAMASSETPVMTDVEGIGRAVDPLAPISGDEPGGIEPRSIRDDDETRSSERLESALETTDRELTTVSTVNGDGREGQRA